MTFCPCNTIDELASGGASLGGSADVSTYVPAGVVLGGSAIVEVRPDPWDGMVFVLPLDEDGTTFLDRTKNHLDGTSDTATSPTIDAGVFCLPSQYFDERDFITLPQDTLRATQGFTVSMWLKLDSEFQERTFYSRGIEVDGHPMTFSFGHSFLNHLWAKIVLGEEETVYDAFSEPIPSGKWFHVAASWSPSEKLRVFLNGILVGSVETPETSMLATTNGSQLGRRNQSQSLTGNLQEVRLHPVARGSDWLAAEYSNFCHADFCVQGETIEAVSE